MKILVVDDEKLLVKGKEKYGFEIMQLANEIIEKQ